MFNNKAITLTFCDRAENHAGMQMIGDISEKGFSYNDLLETKNVLEPLGYECELTALHDYLDPMISVNLQKPVEEAYLLIIRKGVNAFIDSADDLFVEQNNLNPDKQYFDVRRSKVLNKHARYNLCFSENYQNPDFLQGKGTIINYNSVPLTKELRENIMNYIPNTGYLYCEGNYYYDVTKTGIGYHFDAERRKVIGCRLGESIPLHFMWFHKHKPISEPIIFNLNHGDMYIMSEKTVGTDGKKSSKIGLRHAAGCKKYTDYKPK